MNTTDHDTARRENQTPSTRDEQPLLRVLVAEAARRGDTLAALAKNLGVTYERLAQWRRNDAQIGNAQRAVHVRAAKYLGLPTVLVLTMAGAIQLEEFVWPSKEPLSDRVTRELERLRQDPHLGAFVPPELASCTLAVKLFVAFLYREISAPVQSGHRPFRWVEALHQAALGDARGTSELQSLRKQATEEHALF